MNKSDLRKLIRHKRRSLTPRRRQHAARRLLSQLHQSSQFLSAKRVALYLTNDGEIDTQFVLRDLQQRGKQAYLPVLHPLKPGHLSFIRYNRNSRMRTNRYGISEPDFRYGHACPARFLDVICLPLVAFDQRGNRLGMGGGYYDRTLAFMHQPGKQPRLIGCAYEFQQVPQLPAESWDIPIRAIATEASFRQF
jgi:5-formyltetrahydrofolate cyclo-ligase